MDFVIESYELDFLKKALKPYQVSIIDDLMTKYTVEDAIEKYLTANGPCNTVQFGGMGGNNNHPFITNFKDEINKLICGHKDYEDFYSKIDKGTSIPIQALISAISAAIGAKIGINAAMISPVVVLCLSLVGKVGRNAYCKTKGYPLQIESQ